MIADAYIDEGLVGGNVRGNVWQRRKWSRGDDPLG
jgi:hypothetical protein